MTSTGATIPTPELQTSDTGARCSAHPLPRNGLTDFVLPTLLFMALGGMTWPVRGSSGFGAMNGCVFAGMTLGTAWWFLSRPSAPGQVRRYSSDFAVLALTLGIGLSGNRGWMQWPSFFDGQLQLNSAEARFAPVPRTWGFIWLFIAGVPWAGLGACLLAWCSPKQPLRVRDWILRFACGIAVAGLLRESLRIAPGLLLPLFDSLKPEYLDLQRNPNLARLLNDDRDTLTHLGLYLGFLLFEFTRRDWRNVTLISTVGLVNGVGWALCQNWKWAPHLWPQAHFNWWRCWESCGGLSIGFAFGLAFYLSNVRVPKSRAPEGSVERFGLYSALVLGLGLSIKNGFKGWANIYLGNEEHCNRIA